MSSEKDKASLLDALRLERAPETAPRRLPPRFVMIAAAVIVILLASGAAWYWWPDNGIAIQAVTAQSASAAPASALDASGYVVARRQATLSAKILGKLVEVDVEEGDKVKKGQIIARLDDSNYMAALHVARAQEQQAEAAFHDTAPIYARYARLSKQGAISADAFENQRAAYDNARESFAVARANLAMAQSNENDTVVRAPFTGVVTDKAAQPGEIVAPSAAGGGFTRTGIATIVDMDSLEVQVDVSENFIDRVHPGQPATIKLNAYPDWDIPASVIAVIPTADESKGTVTVRVAIHAKDSRILPQMGARVSFLTGGIPTLVKLRGVTVPANAVAGSGRKRTVFVIQDDGTVQARTVQVGSVSAQGINILSGLAPGDRVVAGDLSRLRDGAKVQVQD